MDQLHRMGVYEKGSSKMRQGGGDDGWPLAAR